VTNDDGDVALRKNGLTYSGSPTWVTASLSNIINATDFDGTFEATGATSYSNTTSLPSGFNLISANGYYYGNIEVELETTYNFTIRATDDENQDSDKAFSLTAQLIVPVEYLVAGGGGGGGGNAPAGDSRGGGGCGGVLTGNTNLLPGTTYTITVGAAGVLANPGGRGGNSSFDMVTAFGGGGGAGYQVPGGIGGPGYGGGGGAGYINNPGGPAGQGFRGGNSSFNPVTGRQGGGGGGGMTAVGQDGSSSPASRGGDGGAGLYSTISGANTAYGGGGGGRPGGLGGVGGGGNSDTSGTTNTGGGGGGNAAGGSGVVILRTLGTAASTAGSPTVTTDGPHNIYTFTGSGSITF
jgi:hypothetical protein